MYFGLPRPAVQLARQTDQLVSFEDDAAGDTVGGIARAATPNAVAKRVATLGNGKLLCR